MPAPSTTRILAILINYNNSNCRNLRENNTHSSGGKVKTGVEKKGHPASPQSVLLPRGGSERKKPPEEAVRKPEKSKPITLSSQAKQSVNKDLNFLIRASFFFLFFCFFFFNLLPRL